MLSIHTKQVCRCSCRVPGYGNKPYLAAWLTLAFLHLLLPKHCYLGHQRVGWARGVAELGRTQVRSPARAAAYAARAACCPKEVGVNCLKSQWEDEGWFGCRPCHCAHQLEGTGGRCLACLFASGGGGGWGMGKGVLREWAAASGQVAGSWHCLACARDLLRAWQKP
jgi:hypothetical protein